jgi:hypothetical protein
MQDYPPVEVSISFLTLSVAVKFPPFSATERTEEQYILENAEIALV